MSTGRFLGGLLIGGALGAIIGMLVAPRSGEETREIIRDEFSERLNRSLDGVKTRATDITEYARDRAGQLQEKGQRVAEDLEEAGKETWDKVRSAVKTRKETEESPN